MSAILLPLLYAFRRAVTVDAKCAIDYGMYNSYTTNRVFGLWLWRGVMDDGYSARLVHVLFCVRDESR
jgi:hypothetical protein